MAFNLVCQCVSAADAYFFIPIMALLLCMCSVFLFYFILRFLSNTQFTMAHLSHTFIHSHSLVDDVITEHLDQ